jgi:D-tyrosyl-tRNA(Tyr) deacylase
MRAIIQRVSRSKVTVAGRTVGEIGHGLLVLLGVTHSDGNKDADRLVDKITGLRIFSDTKGKMNLSLNDVGGEMLVVSQFTLYADTRRGKRPSFVDAASGEEALRRYKYFVARARESVTNVATGEFGAMMDVELVNDGPVTIILDSQTGGRASLLA